MSCSKIFGTIIYGAELSDLERDDKYPYVPKFVVECVKIIEQTENIQTDGIYRASGKKESIDKVKKKVKTFYFK